MASNFILDGSIIPRRVKRMFDQRSEPRIDCPADKAILSFRGQDHVVQLVNQSASGAMIRFERTPNIGETLRFRSQERASERAQVRWVRDGKIGLTFLGKVG
ncbi:PilZ domain-containing protein [Sphingomonas piscis]|uniref:PilZ domain-containing protein n=1 Tax=Sphingomonas piscis TaxID=2714943 RepID=A0A6G7YQ55_9SPHN|nr:PilZ domain-containing protein [Sphingomonas piscis]QIK78875.1 PilZ domain-containing protein [Sphingomonas piscis]